jgi:hypothetical protein
VFIPSLTRPKLKYTLLELAPEEFLITDAYEGPQEYFASVEEGTERLPQTEERTVGQRAMAVGGDGFRSPIGTPMAEDDAIRLAERKLAQSERATGLALEHREQAHCSP